MNFLELFLTAVGLAMDAFAVAICIGLAISEANFRKALTVGLYFGIFQAMMPLLGYLLGMQFSSKIISFDHWVAFVLLGFIGGKMVKGCFSQDQAIAPENVSLEFKQMIPLAVATSIDALAAGVSFAFLQVDIIPAVSFIGLVTLTLSAGGVKIGQVFGARFKAQAELVGGVILILIGLKILLEHTGILTL